jgi:peptidoglycan/xylan/chitin deacetylase (PgdA/CDA1 family)
MTRIARTALLIFTVAAVFVVMVVSWPAHAAPLQPQRVATRTPSPAPSSTPQPTATPVPLPASVQVPVLMYHYIAVPPAKADKYRFDLSVTPANFEAQLKYLKENGFTTVSLTDVYDHLSKGKRLPEKPVVLTFDDGHRDAYTNAFPLLKKYRMTGTFFIVTDFINYKDPEYVTWEMVKEMSRAGMHIESHSRTHKDMRRRNNAFLVWEILGPIEQITAYTGKRPFFFCYPGGQYDQAVIDVLRSAGTLAAVTTKPGSIYTLANAMTWPRLRVRHNTTIEQFAAIVEIGD